MNYDNEHWRSLAPPSSPTDSDVEVYRNLLKPGRVLLLGSTKKLLPLCDEARDISPLYPDPRIVRGDWRENRTFFENIIGDGVFHLDRELCDAILAMCRDHSKNFISRSFREKLPTMRYACYFPRAADFSVRPTHMVEREKYVFFQWTF